ncbi:MAG: hypothetical protein K2N70_05125, partial [Helicobacter sp.]|nr:hypothetical protein [Helicobacter sp.]
MAIYRAGISCLVGIPCLLIAALAPLARNDNGIFYLLLLIMQASQPQHAAVMFEPKGVTLPLR